MRYVSILSLALFLLTSVEAQAQWENRITEDRGGNIGQYVDRYKDQRSWHESTVIDGLCASACTLVLANVATEHVCATEHARLGFHAAWDYGAGGTTVTNREATQMLFNSYPAGVRHWIASRGGLTKHMIFLSGRELQRFIPRCTPQPTSAVASFASLPSVHLRLHAKKTH